MQGKLLAKELQLPSQLCRIHLRSLEVVDEHKNGQEEVEPSTLSNEVQRKELDKLLHKYGDIFSEVQILPHISCDHKILLKE